jgi:anionic cell wall polymer biosynthesis LytR-Cps2A-Psr (LCP) family protein
MNKAITIATVLMAAALTGIFSTSAYATDGGDESETNTEQEIKQKNVGSGESTNNNCALNSIDTTTAATVECPVGGPGLVPFEIAE